MKNIDNAINQAVPLTFYRNVWIAAEECRAIWYSIDENTDYSSNIENLFLGDLENSDNYNYVFFELTSSNRSL